MAESEPLVETYKRKLLKALSHLDYNFKKYHVLADAVRQLDDQGLETWASFSARFSRVSDIYLTRYVRAKVLEDDPIFKASLSDFVNQGEKSGLVDDADTCM